MSWAINTGLVSMTSSLHMLRALVNRLVNPPLKECRGFIEHKVLRILLPGTHMGKYFIGATHDVVR